MKELLLEEKINKLNIGDRIKMLRITQKKNIAGNCRSAG